MIYDWVQKDYEFVWNFIIEIYIEIENANLEISQELL